MDNGNSGLHNSDVATLALLQNASYGPRGGYWGGVYPHGHGAGVGYPGNSTLAAMAHANGTADYEAVKGNRDAILAGLTSQGESFREIRNIEQFSKVSDQGWRNLVTLGDKIDNAQLNQLRENADIRQQIATCCCETKAAIAETKAELKTEMLAIEGRAFKDKLDTTRAELTALKTVAGVASTCGCCNVPIQ